MSMATMATVNNNKEVKTETWSTKPPLNTIKEYFTPILQGLRFLYPFGLGASFFKVLYVQEVVTRPKILNRTILSNGIHVT